MKRVAPVLLVLVACGPTLPGGGGDDNRGDAGGGAADAATECDPSRPAFCVGDEVYACEPDGSRGDHLTSCGFESCYDGVCRDECGQAAQLHSYLGCEFWPIDLDNNIDIYGEPINGSDCSLYGSTISGIDWTVQTLDVCSPGAGQANSGGLCDYGGDCSLAGGGSCVPMTLCTVDAGHGPFAVVVSNPDDVRAVDVTLEGPGGESYTTTVAPGAVTSLLPQQLGFADRSLEGSELARKAYRLTSTHPIVAYQFNPLDHAGVFSNDASLLLPSHTYDTTYTAVSWPTQNRRPYRHDSNGFVTVVASEPGTTTVTVTPAAPIRAGLGVDATPAGVPLVRTLQRGEVLNLEAVASADLTGTTVVADRPVGAFSGHEATTLGELSPAACCMDHLEDQLFPLSAWGKRYAVVRFRSRNAGERDILRIVAQKPGTQVGFTPAVATCPVLGPGQWCQVAIDAPVDISATEPVEVAHYMTSIGGTAPDSADPALAMAVPVEQYRTEYTVLVPDEYFYNYFALVAPAGAAVAIDGVQVAMTGFGNGLAWANAPVTPGQHRIACPDGCGVEIYGWADAVSYLFAGGLDLARIVVP